MNVVCHWIIIILTVFVIMAVSVSHDADSKREYEISMAKAGLQECDNGFGPTIWQRECKK